MTSKEIKPGIPKQKKGARSDIYYSSKFKSTNDAAAFFKIAKKRLLNVSDWDKICGKGSAIFNLTDNKGNILNRLASKGDYLRIDIPGPGLKTGNGYDWVRIEAIENTNLSKIDYECISLRVKPAKNPTTNADDIAHFFKHAASSTFLVIRDQNFVRAEIHGRNELPNIHQSKKTDILRNVFIALGAVLGFSKFQWKRLAMGLVSHL